MRTVQEFRREWPLIEQFDLPPSSVCVVAGCYEGLTMGALEEVYRPQRILGFDPQAWVVERAEAHFTGHPWEYYPYAIGTRNASLMMGEWGTDAASFVNVGEQARVNQPDCPIRDYVEVMTELGVTVIDLAIFNMEGYEWLLLPYLVETGLISNIRRLAVQFHAFTGLGRLDHIYDSLAETHDLVVDLFPSWVYWKQKVQA